jgi:hypothetical protein
MKLTFLISCEQQIRKAFFFFKKKKKRKKEKRKKKKKFLRNYKQIKANGHVCLLVRR